MEKHLCRRQQNGGEESTNTTKQETKSVEGGHKILLQYFHGSTVYN